jgi:hypothetical protein
MGLATQIAVCFFSFPPVSDFSGSSTTFQAFFPHMLSSSKEEGKEGRKDFYVQKGEKDLHGGEVDWNMSSTPKFQSSPSPPTASNR